MLLLNKILKMKALEFKAEVKGDSIQIPVNLRDQLKSLYGRKQQYRVILLIEEKDIREENLFKMMAEEQFFDGYSESDSIYDNYKK